MLTAGFIRNNKEKAREGLLKRNWNEEDISILDKVISLDDDRKNIQTELDAILAQINSLSKEIGSLYKSGNASEANTLKEQVTQLKVKSTELENKQKDTKSALQDCLLHIPNQANNLVPHGHSDEDNEVIQEWKESLPSLGENALAHWDLADKYDLINFKLGVKITGAGFPLFRGQGAKLQRALINFFLDEAHSAGYEEVIPPLLVNESSARATGQLPDKEGQMYQVTADELYVIPTAEVPVTNMYRDVIVKEEDFPIKLTGHTPCFRREAGSYGSDVKGLNRVHQFDKVEIVQFQHPEKSYDTLCEMVSYVESLLIKLELPYRILRLCGGDLGQAAAMTYDFEVYSAAQKKWLEVSSVSNFETYQTNRMKMRFKDKNGKSKLAHSLNGSALALARIVAALLENNQSPDGIKIPKVLVPYTKFEFIK